MESIRSFIAIELPTEVRLSLTRLQEGLRESTPPGVKWVDPGNMHLTLKFLGAVPADRLGLVSESLAKGGAGPIPSGRGWAGLGVFPDSRRPRVVWVGLVGEVAKLVQLQQAINLALIHLGFSKENRPFVPHLTLARLREDTPPHQRQGFAQRFLEARLEMLPPFKVQSINLMKSQLTPRGAIYSRLGTFDFF